MTLGSHHCTRAILKCRCLPTEEWLKVDPLVKSWIFLTCNDVLVGRLVKANPKTALDAWTFLEKVFKDNKRTKTIALRGELRVLDIGDMTCML
ncbi:hypothetical protein CTI12_AA251570 [Artemisia annua]|uniref:Uncharacterized protein n=1 Tax=Artemisia annua TaxID=35608 RepID=A0A2U1NLM3_ARTAN|nr:hypothetical protein CTI12_AA251570 [Artemisia annua]